MANDLEDEERGKDIDEEIRELMSGHEIGPEEGIVGDEEMTEGLEKEGDEAEEALGEEEA